MNIEGSFLVNCQTVPARIFLCLLNFEERESFVSTWKQ